MGKMDPEMLMQAYQKVGLDEAFSKAIVEGGNAKHIVETWKADWREDNGAEHPAIRAVLEGHATPEQARSLLEAADEHRDLVEAVAAGTKSVEWAHIVLSAGFKGKKEAVSALLDGADSTIIAHILDVELSDADAKAIGRGGHRKKRASGNGLGISSAKINKMEKSEIVRELVIAGVPYTGNRDFLMEKLIRYRSFLRVVIGGMRKGKYAWNLERVHYSGNARNYEYHKRANRNSLKENFSGPANVTGLRKAGKQLHVKGAAKLPPTILKKKILEQGLRYGFVTEDEFDDLLEGPSDFNKT
jgi:hypothetical protein